MLIGDFNISLRQFIKGNNIILHLVEFLKFKSKNVELIGDEVDNLTKIDKGNEEIHSVMELHDEGANIME